MSGQMIERKPICHGDGQESERLYGLAVGHVLTEADVRDIQNLIADNNDEIGNTIEILHEAHRMAVADTAPDKEELINRIAVLECNLAVEKAMRHYDQKCFEKGVAASAVGRHS